MKHRTVKVFLAFKTQMPDLSSHIETSFRRITKELKRIEMNFDKALGFTNAGVAALEKKEKENDRKFKLLEKRIRELESEKSRRPKPSTNKRDFHGEVISELSDIQQPLKKTVSRSQKMF